MKSGRTFEKPPRLLESRTRALVQLVFFLIQFGFLASCGQPTPAASPAPTATLAIRHRDAMPLMLQAQDLGATYQNTATQRLDRGRGWGDDTTRLSGYRMTYESADGVFSRVECQVECYLSVSDAQTAYRAHRQQLAASLDASAKYDSVRDSEERLLGDWNRKFIMTESSGATEIRYLVLRENVLAELTFAGPDSPEIADQAARKARLLDERIFQR